MLPLEKQNIQDEKTCESKTANLLVLQPSKEGKTRTPMQKAIVNQYSNLIAGSCDFSFFNEQVNDTYKGLGWVFVPVRRGKSISRKQDRPPNLLFQHSTEIIITCPKKRKIYQCNGGTWLKMMLVCTYIGGRKGLNTRSLGYFRSL